MPQTMYIRTDDDDLTAYTKEQAMDPEVLNLYDVDGNAIEMAVYELKGYVVVRDVTKRTITKA